MVSKTLLVGILVILVIAGMAGYFLTQKPSVTPTETKEVTIPEVMTEEEINSLNQSIGDIEAIESGLNITEMDLNIDFSVK